MRDGTSTLVRVIARNGEVVTDRSATLPGRGAWVHPTRTCTESAIQRKAFGRALKAGTVLNTGQVLDLIQAPPGALEEQAD
jgi:predicted RNA-binding protein YlxR (DUF448 family)